MIGCCIAAIVRLSLTNPFHQKVPLVYKDLMLYVFVVLGYCIISIFLLMRKMGSIRVLKGIFATLMDSEQERSENQVFYGEIDEDPSQNVDLKAEIQKDMKSGIIAVAVLFGSQMLEEIIYHLIYIPERDQVMNKKYEELTFL